MKKLLFLSLGLLSFSFLRAADYKLTIQVETSKAGTQANLSVLQGKTPSPIGTSTVAPDGTVTFEGHLEIPMMADLAIDGKGINFMLENSSIHIDWTGAKPVITGSKEQAILDSFDEQGKAANIQTTEQYLTFSSTFFQTNPNSVAAAYILFRQVAPRLDPSQLRAYAASFSPAVQESIYLKIVGEMATKLEATAIGKRYVDFALADTLGQVIPLSSVVGKTPTTYVLVDFWASWCGPCRAENPNVVAAFNQFKDNGFTVFGVSLDRPGQANRWKAAIVKDQLNWTNVSDLKFWDCEAAAIYGVRSIPSNVLIGPDGTIVAKNLRGEDLIQKLSEIYTK